MFGWLIVTIIAFLRQKGNFLDKIHGNMKKICAIICEYDPFHNGHKYQIEQARRQSGCDFVLCLMSGSFVQRGYPASVDKHTRTKHALQNGADMVVLLPTVFATSSAYTFALGACKILSHLRVSHLSFGIEPECMDIIKNVDNWDFDKIKMLSKDLSKTGINSAKAYQQAVLQLYGDRQSQSFDKPNFVLAYEYCKAIKNLNQNIKVVPIVRTNEYHCSNLTKPFASATAIRRALQDGLNYDEYVPYQTIEIQQNNDIHFFEKTLLLYLKNTDIEILNHINGVTEGIGYKLKKQCQNISDYHSLIDATKSKRYLHSRIRRILLQNYLGITKDIVEQSLNASTIYCHLLGIKQENLHIMKNFDSLWVRQKDIPSAKEHTSLLGIENRADKFYGMLSGINNVQLGDGLIKV